MDYRGRFAPSPSGPLHFGSLIAAFAGYLQARARRGKWLVRIEDIDLPRSMTGADKLILQTLEKLGLHWDEDVIYQSRRHKRYAEALAQLQQDGHLYPCSCSRRQTAGRPYSGKCRNGAAADKSANAIRIRVDRQQIHFVDQIQGPRSERLDSAVGDFIVKRADRITSYNLAVVVDDADQRISEVARGTDLIGTTARQIFLQSTLGFATPSYLHFPVAVDAAGKKLSKQNHAPAIDVGRGRELLLAALYFLGQEPDKALQAASSGEIIRWGIENWRLSQVPRRQTIHYPLPREAAAPS